jgi:hypothetical protein
MRKMAFLPTEQQADYIFRFEGPLGSFSRRIEVAHLFGVIDEKTRGQLNDLRELRNACAHGKQRIDFSVPELANVARRLLHPNGTTPLLGKTPQLLKASFVMECVIIAKVLGDESRAAAYLDALELVAQVVPEPSRGKLLQQLTASRHRLHTKTAAEPPQQSSPE